MKLLTDIQKELLIAAAAALLLVGALAGAPSATAAQRPNFVIIQTDDQSPELLRSEYRGKNGKFRKTMPNTVRQIFQRGTEFRNYYATSPVCSPSRASLLNGQYPRNNNLLSNDGPFGGWQGWQSQAISRNNIPLALKQAGYRTSHFGKFMNSYFDLEAGRPTREVPRGWNTWFTASFRSGDNRFYGYPVNNGGQIQGPFGSRNYTIDKRIDPAACQVMTAKVRVEKGRPKERCNYATDLYTRKAVKELRSVGRKRKPFYVQIDYDAPHGDVRPPVGPQPATRHIGKASRTPLKTNPNFNEWDLSDKPSLIRAAAPRLLNGREKRKLKTAYQSQLESLMAIDESVKAIVKTLRRTGELDNTFIIFTSDHGYFLGEHRFALAKFLPYESSSSVSMAVRGPGVPRRSSSGEIVGNIDVPATVADLAGIEPDYLLDGRSLKAFWKDPNRRSRRPIAISLYNQTGEPQLPGESQLSGGPRVSARAPALRYRGYRVGPYKLVRYLSGGGRALRPQSRPLRAEEPLRGPGLRRRQALSRVELQRGHQLRRRRMPRAAAALA